MTLRLGDSLPKAIIDRLSEVQRTIEAIEAGSSAFLGLQRRYFQTMEKYLDAGAGVCALQEARIAAIAAQELAALEEWEVEVPHYTVMPNHLHALIVPHPDCRHSLADIMKRLKGRTAHRIRRQLPGENPVWQREWFDRWLRDDSEWDKVVNYIRQNPVKARLVAQWQDHPWTK